MAPGTYRATAWLRVGLRALSDGFTLGPGGDENLTVVLAVQPRKNGK